MKEITIKLLTRILEAKKINLMLVKDSFHNKVREDSIGTITVGTILDNLQEGIDEIKDAIKWVEER